MADSVSEIKAKFKAHDVPITQDDVWAVQGVTVVKHKALERLAAKIGIEWTVPTILRCERDEAVILVTGSIDRHTEWSIGEAVVVPMIESGKLNKWGKPVYEAVPGAIGNYQITPKQASYVWAMAEKRGKDRVILKLAGLDAYSEEESDDFAHRQSSRDTEAERDTGPSATEILTLADKSLMLAAEKGPAALKEAWIKLSPATRELFGEAGACPKRFKDVAAKHNQSEAA